MRRYLSVWMLLARSTLRRLALVLLGMAVLETALFARASGQYFKPAIEGSGVGRVFYAAYTAFCVILCACGTERGSRSGYTLQRLQISERRLFALQCIHNFCCLTILWGAQVLLVLALARWYGSAFPERMGRQTLLLAFYRSDFLHAILPLSEITRWVRNLVYAVCASVILARTSLMQRYRTKMPVVGLTVVLVGVRWGLALGNIDFDCIAAIVASLVAMGMFSSAWGTAHPGTRRETDPWVETEGVYTGTWEEAPHEETS